jgi:hypothetical protein
MGRKSAGGLGSLVRAPGNGVVADRLRTLAARRRLAGWLAVSATGCWAPTLEDMETAADGLLALLRSIPGTRDVRHDRGELPLDSPKRLSVGSFRCRYAGHAADRPLEGSQGEPE